MKIRVKRDLTSGLVLVVLSAVIWLVIPKQVSGVDESTFGAQLFPRIVVAAMFCLAATIVLRSLLGKRDPYVEFDLSAEWKILLFAAGIVLYVFVTDLVGFLIATLGFCAATLWVFKSRWHGYVSMAVFVGAVDALFRFALGINLP